MKFLLQTYLFCLFALPFFLTSCSSDEDMEVRDDPSVCETVWYADVDNDGFGNVNNPIKACIQPVGFVQDSLDLDDSQSGVDTVSNATKVQRFMNALSTGDTTVLQFISDDSFVQRNPFIPDGKEGLRTIIDGNPTDLDITIHRFLVEDDIYILHSTYQQPDTAFVVFDIFRFDNGTMVEHWDNTTGLLEDADSTTQVNGPTEVMDLDQTSANRLRVQKMTEVIFLDGVDEEYYSYFADSSVYVQHGHEANPDTSSILIELNNAIIDGEGIRDFVEFIYAQGDFVLVLSESIEMVDGYPVACAHYDLFRLSNNFIVEHWEVVQEIPESGTSGVVNDNGKWR